MSPWHLHGDLAGGGKYTYCGRGMHVTDPRTASLRDALVGKVLRGSGGVNYHLKTLIGEGGQGWVFKANWDEPDGLVVIVKVLRPDAVHGDTLRRFQREAEVLRMLSQQARPNPHIVRFFDHAAVEMPLAGEKLSLPYTVLEYVNGPTLEQVLATSNGKGLAVERVRRLARQIVLALEAVHAQKVVHRDLKPSNILLATEAGTEIAKVTDFGLVKLVDVNLQRTSALAGASLGYAPPEQYEQGNKRVGPRTDVFSLAAIIYEMLTGVAAFPYRDGENPLLIVTRILNGNRPQLMKMRDNLPPELATQTDVIEAIDLQLSRATRPDPADRHESVKELWNSLEGPLRAATEPKRNLFHGVPESIVSPFVATESAFGKGPSSRRSSVPAIHAATAAMAGRPTTPNTPPPGQAFASALSSTPHVAAQGSSPYGPAPLRPSQRVRVPEIAAANPAAWVWSVATRSLNPGTVRAAAFSPGGEHAIAAGPSGVARWERGAWFSIPLPPMIDVRTVRAIQWLRDGEALVIGEHGLAMRLSLSGAADIWSSPDREITFLGAHVEEGLITLVGERPAHGLGARPGKTVGLIAQRVGDRFTLAADVPACTRLRSATRLTGGTLLACGDVGTLLRLEMGVPEHLGSVCGGHLTAIDAVADGGAVTVGAGGHALYVNARLEAQLEAVQTTRDLLALTIGEDGAAWAGSAQARLLRRSGTGWLRMSGEVGITPSIVSVWAGARLVRAICDDGAVIEGKLGA